MWTVTRLGLLSYHVYIYLVAETTRKYYSEYVVLKRLTIFLIARIVSDVFVENLSAIPMMNSDHHPSPLSPPIMKRMIVAFRIICFCISQWKANCFFICLIQRNHRKASSHSETRLRTSSSAFLFLLMSCYNIPMTTDRVRLVVFLVVPLDCGQHLINCVVFELMYGIITWSSRLNLNHKVII